jgi:hypothetical protein
MVAQLGWREVNLRAETLKKCWQRKIERGTTFIPGKDVGEVGRVDLSVRALAAGEDDHRRGMGRSLTKSEPERQVIPTEDHDPPLAPVLIHDGVPPQQTGLANESIRVNGDGHPRILGT